MLLERARRVSVRIPTTPTTGPAAGFGPVSGMAPRARVAMYKALWSTQDASTASGNTSDLVAAIDQAVTDGVDVINYSVSGTTTNFLDPVQVSFLFAADAGVFVSTSAGNNGPDNGTVAHPGPWLTTVAALVTGSVGLGLAVAAFTAAPVAVYLALLFVLGCATSLHSPASSALRWTT